MRVFNRIVIVLLLVGLFALGLVMAIYGFEFSIYRFEDLPRILGLDVISEGLNGLVRRAEGGALSVPDVTALVVVALLGLILLIFELKPPSPRRIRMRQGTYITRRAVESETTEVVEQSPEVLGTRVNVKAQRRPGAKIGVTADVRPSEDVQSAQESVRERVRRRLDERGVPVSSLRIKLLESDPRRTQTRVR
jgi:hypothetical protein